MLNTADAYRRWLGMLCLSLAAGMLIWGRTLLLPHLTGVLFQIFWGLCLILSAAAVCLAVTDIYHTIRHWRRQRREAVEEAFAKIHLHDDPPR